MLEDAIKEIEEKFDIKVFFLNSEEKGKYESVKKTYSEIFTSQEKFDPTVVFNGPEVEIKAECKNLGTF